MRIQGFAARRAMACRRPIPLSLFAVALGWALLGAPQARATTYNVSVTQGADSISGSITTDGATGALSLSDLTAWNLEVNNGAGDVNLLGPGGGQNSSSELTVGLLVATASKLSFLFDSNSQDGFFQIASYSGCPGCTFFDLGARGTGSGYITIFSNGSYGPGNGVAYTGSDVIGTAAATPLPAALPMFAGGAGLLGFLVRRRRRKTA